MRVRSAGLAAVVGAAMAISANAVVRVVGLTDPPVDREQLSYPLTTSTFAAGQIWFALTQALMAIGVWGLVRSTLVTASRSRSVLGTMAVLGMAITVPGELVLILVAASDPDSGAVSAASSVFGVGLLLTDIGLVGFGVVALRQRRWTLPWRALPLAFALFQLLIATPVLLAVGFAGLVSFAVIAVSDLLMALIGIAVFRAGTTTSPEPRSSDDRPTAVRSPG